jgi:hypothetical protein
MRWSSILLALLHSTRGHKTDTALSEKFVEKLDLRILIDAFGTFTHVLRL